MKMLFGIGVLVIGCSVMLYSPVFGDENTSDEVISVDESFFSNRDNPIVLDFKRINNSDQLNDLLEEYLQKNYEGYEIKGRMFSMNEDRFVIAFSLKNDDDKRALVYFDMTDAYKKLDKGKNETKKIVKAWKARHRK